LTIHTEAEDPRSHSDFSLLRRTGRGHAKTAAQGLCFMKHRNEVQTNRDTAKNFRFPAINGCPAVWQRKDRGTSLGMPASFHQPDAL